MLGPAATRGFRAFEPAFGVFDLPPWYACGMDEIRFDRQEVLVGGYEASEERELGDYPAAESVAGAFTSVE